MIINSNNQNNFNRMNKLPNAMKRGFSQTPDYIRNSIQKQNDSFKRNQVITNNPNNITLNDKIAGLNKLNRINKGGR